MTITIELISFSITLSILLGIIQFLISIWIKSRLEQSIKHEYDKKLEEYKFTILQREQAAKVAELFAKWGKYNGKDDEILTDEQKRDRFEELNKLTWELAMWIPDEKLVIEIMNRLANHKNASEPKDLIIKMRELILQKPVKELKGSDLVHFL